MTVNRARTVTRGRCCAPLSAIVVLLIAWCLVLRVSNADPVDLTSEEEMAIRDVIGRQLEAFQRDQAELAFSYASPGIQEKFQTPTRFLSMVKTHYAAVYRPREIEFLSLTYVENTWVQEVLFAEDNGNIYIARYPMERQGDGQWRIDGCMLTLQTDKSI